MLPEEKTPIAIFDKTDQLTEFNVWFYDRDLR